MEVFKLFWNILMIIGCIGGLISTIGSAWVLFFAIALAAALTTFVLHVLSLVAIREESD